MLLSQQQALHHHWAESTSQQEEESLQVWGQRRTEGYTTWPEGKAEGVQRLLQEEAGGQTPAEQCEGCVDWNEGNNWVQGGRQTARRQPGEGKSAKFILQQVQCTALICPPTTLQDFNTLTAPMLLPSPTLPAWCAPWTYPPPPHTHTHTFKVLLLYWRD